MALTERARGIVVTGALIAVVGGLVAVGWMVRDPAPPVGRGETAPALRLPLVDGDTVDLAGLRGQVVLLNVWATWCPPCITELPSMERVYRRYGGMGLEVVAVSVDSSPGEPGPDGRVVGVVSAFVDRFGLTFPVALDPAGQTERDFGVGLLPTTFLIDREGRIRGREVGGRHWDTEPYVTLIESLLGEERG